MRFHLNYSVRHIIHLNGRCTNESILICPTSKPVKLIELFCSCLIYDTVIMGNFCIIKMCLPCSITNLFYICMYACTCLQWLIGDRESHCATVCSKTHGKPVCGSDGRSYDTSCDLQRAKCKDRTLSLAHRGRCKG